MRLIENEPWPPFSDLEDTRRAGRRFLPAERNIEQEVVAAIGIDGNVTRRASRRPP